MSTDKKRQLSGFLFTASDVECYQMLYHKGSRVPDPHCKLNISAVHLEGWTEVIAGAE